MKNQSRILFIIFINFILFFLSCDKGVNSTTLNDDEVVISENVVLPDEDPEITIDEIAEDQITLTFEGDQPDITENDILVGGNMENGGYLRKVVSVTVDGNTMEIETVQAVLTEAISVGSLDTTLSLDFGLNRSLYGLELVRKMDGVTVKENGINISGTELFDGNFYGTDVLISIPTGTITFTPELNLGFDIQWFGHLHEFHAIASGELDFNFDIRGEFSGSLADFNNDDDPVELASFSRSFYQTIAGFPVWETVTLAFEAGYSVDIGYSGAVQAGFDSSIGIECGAVWLEGDWSGVWNPSYNFNWHPPEWNAEAHVQIRGYVRPTISIELYSMAGPYLDVEPYLRYDAGVNANPPSWQWGLYGGMESTLGIQIHVLDWDLAEWNTELLNPAYEVLIYSDNGTLDNITVTSPNGGGNWQMGSTHTISWDDNISGNVKIELYRSGSFDRTIASSTGSNGSYSWNIPTNLTASSSYKVKITSTSNSSVYDYSDSYFTISEEPPADYITVTSPNGGEDWQMGSSHTITWDDNISSNVKIELYRSGSFDRTITSSTGSDGSYSWNIPTNLTTSSTYKVQITSTSNSSVYDYSNNYFTISETGGGSGECIDFDGNSYETATIGDQEWMAENLKVTHYRNGDPIPTGYSNSDWTNLSTGAFAVYDNNPANAGIYGYLYNWYAVNDSRGICPEGWHVPTDAEWTELTNYLGSNAGGKLKEVGFDHWNSPNTGATNETGFTALPGGYRDGHDGHCYYVGVYGYFWSSTAYGSYYAWDRFLYYGGSVVGRYYIFRQVGFSVRCVRD